MAGEIVVAGVVNVQQTVPIDVFPLPYAPPVRYPTHGLRLDASGVSLNVARVLAALGSPVALASLVGTDPAGVLARAELDRLGLLGPGVVTAAATPMSAVLVDRDGARQIHTDLKGLPEAIYPHDVFRGLLTRAGLAVVSTIGFARPLLALSREAGVPIAVDVQAVSGVDDEYNQPWMATADLLFCSGERLGTSPADFAAAALARFPARCVVVGLGAEGALLAARDRPTRRVAAVAPRGVVDTTGAGDALFAGFLHYWLATGDMDTAMDRAVVVAGHAVGTPGPLAEVSDSVVTAGPAPARGYSAATERSEP